MHDHRCGILNTLIETKEWLTGVGRRNTGRCWSKRTKPKLCKNSSGDLMYSMGTAVNNTTYLKFAKKVDKCLTTGGKKRKGGRKENGN